MCASPAIARTYLMPAVSPRAERIGRITADASLVAMRGLTISAATTGASAGVMDAGAEHAASIVNDATTTTADRLAIFIGWTMGRNAAPEKCLRNGTDIPPTRLSAKRRTASGVDHEITRQPDAYRALINATTVSSMRLEKPHSLSYQLETLTSRPATFVRVASKIEERGS